MVTGEAGPAKTFVFFRKERSGPPTTASGSAMSYCGAAIASSSLSRSRSGERSKQKASKSASCAWGLPLEPEVPGQFWKDFIRDTAPVFRRSTLDQLEGFIAPTWQALVDGARYVNPRLEEIFDELNPDVIVEDNVVSFPAISASGRPWVRIASCNPLEMKGPDLPPTFSGYAIDERARWREFRDEYSRSAQTMQAEFSEFCVEHGAPPCPNSSSSTNRPGSTCICIRRSSTTHGVARLRRHGAISRRAFGPRIKRGIRPTAMSLPSSTSASDRSARPTWL